MESCLHDSHLGTGLWLLHKPGTDEYRPVQHLCAMDQATETTHPTVPDSYTSVGLISADAAWFTCLNLEDAFFCLCLDTVSMSAFAFQWEDRVTGIKEQPTWMRLPKKIKKLDVCRGDGH